MASHKYLVVKGPLTCSTLRKAAESAAPAATINGPWENCRCFISQRVRRLCVRYSTIGVVIEGWIASIGPNKVVYLYNRGSYC